MWAEESECLDLMSCYIFLFFKPAGDLGFAFPGGGTLVKNLPANAGDAGDVGSIPQSGRSPGVGNGNPLQYSCPWTEEPGGLQSVGSQKSWTQLDD